MSLIAPDDTRNCGTLAAPRMVNRFRLAGVLSELDAEVRAIVPVDGFGLVIGDEGGDFSFLSRRRWGNSGYSFPIGDLPAPFASAQVRPSQYTPLSAAFDPT